MRAFALALALVALPLSACSGCSAVSALTSNTAVLGSTALDEKALYAAEAAFYGANTAADVAFKAGLLTAGSPNAVKIADALAAGHSALLLARSAYAAGDAKTFSAKVTASETLIAQAWALIPNKKAS